MRYGYHLGLGLYSPYIMTLTILLIALIVYLVLKQKSVPPSRYFIKLLDVLKGKYAEGLITYDEYAKRKVIIENCDFLSPYSLILLERYAKCEIDTTELFRIKKIVENENIDVQTRENLSKGVNNYEK
ncbi:SHOCT domain-containing protein [Clostridium sp. PL3]|uniref:SHOCT domain-containing protein n=1 Tax=Clostridium thailandense TaxID=2794346 RepID=A0A949U0P7_9CLOT|nr:SHOCT domain-containing protein [Clostridium thailandense]MBV7274124.1 SHOCT domain-containing protein [Clostridium thailandense]